MFAIVTHTPLWVWPLLALLLWLGVVALRRRAVPLWRLLVVPALFITWGGLSLVQRAQATPSFALVWLGAAVLGAVLARALWRLEAAAPDRARNLVTVRGTALPLVRNIVLFVAKYALAVAMARAPTPLLALGDIAVSGLGAGYFLGWIAMLARAYRAAPPLTAPPALP